jgi:hypothetical protein
MHHHDLCQTMNPSLSIKTKKKLFLALTGFILIGTFIISPFGEFALWLFDEVRGFRQKISVYHDHDVMVTFHQKADGDFYRSYFKVEHRDGVNHEFQLDHDGERWWNLGVHREGSRYVVTGQSPWRSSPSSYFDLESRELYAGRYKTFCRLDGKLISDRP